MKKIAFCLLTCVTLSLAAGGSVPQGAAGLDHYELGTAFLNNDNIEQSVSELEKACAKDPKNIQYLNNLALAYRKAGKPDRALNMLDKALRLDEKYLAALHNKVLILLDKKSYTRALDVLETVRQLEPTHLDLGYYTGLAYFGQKQYAKAIAAFESEQNTRRSTELLYNKSICYYQLAEYEQAKQSFLALVGSDPSTAPAYYYLADIYEREGLITEAIEALTYFSKLATSSEWIKRADDWLERLIKKNAADGALKESAAASGTESQSEVSVTEAAANPDQ